MAFGDFLEAQAGEYLLFWEWQALSSILMFTKHYQSNLHFVTP